MKQMEKQLIKNVDEKEFDRVMRMVENISEQERHFNSLETDYRKLCSTWLLASLGACGYVLAEETIPFDKWYFVFGICVAGAIGTGILWMLDLNVYHRLLHSFFKEGVQLEIDYRWLRPIRINMLKSQYTGDIVSKVQYFYFISMTLLLVLGTISIWNFKILHQQDLVKYVCTAGILGVLFTIRFFLKSGKSKDIKKLLADYDQIEAS